jgi:xylobiose transport system permease protein
MILAVVGSLTTFDTILILTRGGPGSDTTNTAFYMYSVGFLSFDFGRGSAAAVILVVVATLLSLVLVRASGYDRMRSQQQGIL